MPLHVQKKCKDGGGDCGGMCNACCLAWCEVCGCAEATLPTDCPGVRVDGDTETNIANGEANYTDESGWHFPKPGTRIPSPRFAQ